ncbi:MAG: hypothetical protein HKN01_10555, partial [Acidimicrobiia bacterium]|nr:hypothetical protein [Acidimicrobiia bacterium]
VVVTTGEDDAWLAGSGEAGDRGWIDHPGQNDVMVPDRWLAAEVGATELVVCIRYVATESIAQRCSYTGGQEVIYQRRDVEVTVYDASTAQVVGQKKLWGPSTVDCPTVETFYGGGDSKTRYLDWPTTAEVKAVLASFIEG